jgi:glycosyltransferase involved in cell wall biosynthesis
MATVDVLIPTYNRSAMLHRCLESIQAQTYTDIRVIVGDDGVDSGTRMVAQDFCGRDGRFNYVHNGATLGIFGNTNALFTQATAPYVHFMHDDDWLEPCFYERMIAGLEESPEAGLAWPGVTVFEEETGVDRRFPQKFSHDEVVRGETAFGELLHDCFITCPAVILRTSVLREVGPFAEYLTADWLMWMRIALRHDLKFIDAPMFHLRRHRGQTSADFVLMGRDGIDMFAFALQLEEFSDRKAEIAVARFEFTCNCILGLKEVPQASRPVRELSSYFLEHVPDHHLAMRKVEIIVLAFALLPTWLRPRKTGRLRQQLRHLFLPWGQR